MKRAQMLQLITKEQESTAAEQRQVAEDDIELLRMELENERKVRCDACTAPALLLEVGP